MKLSEALQGSVKCINELLGVLGTRVVGSSYIAVQNARKFSEEYLRYVRTRRCCMNCAFCKLDDGALHVGRTSDPPVCTYARYEGGRDVYIYDDPAEAGRACGRFALKHEIKEVK